MGSRRIHVKEDSPENSPIPFLLVLSDEKLSSYYINGVNSLSGPGRPTTVIRAGTKFHYNVKGVNDVITSAGPLLQPVTLLVRSFRLFY